MPDQSTPSAGADSPHLEDDERSQAAAHSAPRPLVIHEIVREEGEIELRRAPGALAWSGLAAGLSMGFSFLTQALLRGSLPDAPWRHLVDSAGYSLGFIITVLGRQQLFTESTLTAMLPVLTRREMSALLAMLRLWAIVLAANLVGTFLFALLLTAGGLLPPETPASLHALAEAAVAGPFWPTLLRAVIAGWLIALMVWLLPSARSARLLVILLITWVVAMGHFSHTVAGSVEAFYAVITGAVPPSAYLTGFLLPTLAGNVIGGVSLVALLNHAPLVGELDGEEEEAPADEPARPAREGRRTRGGRQLGAARDTAR